MTSYIEAAVNVPQVSGVFHYHLPPELEGRVQPGQLVVVPFGEQTVQGVVLRAIDEPEVAQTKPVAAVLDEDVVLTGAQIKLARHLAASSLAPLAAVIALMVPTGLGQRADVRYELVPEPPDPDLELKKNQTRLVALLHKRGPLRGRQIDRALPRLDWRRAARELLREGWLESSHVLPRPRVRPKYVRTVQLSVPPEHALAGMQGLGSKPHTQERRQQILKFLAEEPGPVDVNWLYALFGGEKDKRILADLKKLHRSGFVMLREEQAWRDPLAGLEYDPSAPPPLTADQQTAWESISAGFDDGGTYLLHGVTGSGKTELYLRAVAETLKRGQQAIVLVPEIALTPQTVRRFYARFPGRVGLVHSRLSEGERYDTWRRARQGLLPVVVGPRSALFTPMPDLGLIVVDESHDDSYYQFESPPHYHARQAAVEYAALTGALCLLGSATPDVTSYYQAQEGEYHLLELPDRILAHVDTVKAYAEKLGQPARYRPAGEQAEMTDLPPVEVVDMRQELTSGNRSIFSRALQAALAEVLEKQQQAILFLNRRGSATYVFCRDCGFVLRCPNCDTSLTFHQQGGSGLVCHHCGYSRRMPKTCPECSSERIRHFGTGTERVEAEVQALLPAARTLRWDHETTRQKGAHEIILNHFSSHRADILVGTQMLAKGLDLPLVTLVGVVLADVGLHLPDYRAGERVFQVLAQVAGRAGRSPLGGQVILQTFHPDQYVIQAAAAHDYHGFVERELEYRRQLRYPPYTRLVRLLYRHHQEARAQGAAERLAGLLKTKIERQERRATEIIGPAPAFYSRLDGRYRWQLILRGPDPASLLADEHLQDWRVEVLPQSLL